jgi:hypothetical protein
MTSAHRIPRQEYWETSREANIKEQKGSDKEKENWISRKTHIERPPSPNSVPQECEPAQAKTTQHVSHTKN